jgi:undecaprenyl-diphosphatase
MSQPSVLQIVFLAIIQGLAELLPVSSSAHVIAAEKLMGLDPSSPEMTFLLVMLHTGTMGAVIIYFFRRWKAFYLQYLGRVTDKIAYLKSLVFATAATGIVGLGIKFVIQHFTGNELESMFKNLAMVAAALFAVGVLIIIAGKRESRTLRTKVDAKSAIIIGVVQGLCLPFRGFSRSGATISTALLRGVSRPQAEDFSFALVVILTGPVIVHQGHRLLSAHCGGLGGCDHLVALLTPGLLGMIFSFTAGLVALRWLSAWLERGKWKYFGYYCIFASLVFYGIHRYQM